MIALAISCLIVAGIDIPVDKMSLKACRAELKRIQAEGFLEVEQLKRENQRLRDLLDEAYRKLDAYHISTRPADPSKRPKGFEISASDGLDVSEIKRDTQNNEWVRINGIVRNMSSDDYEGAVVVVSVETIDTEQCLQTVVETIDQPILAGQMRRFDMYVDYFPKTKFSIMVRAKKK